jgi:hypothetical protein
MPISGNLIAVSFISGGTTIGNMSSRSSNTWLSTGSLVIEGPSASQIHYTAQASTSNSLTSFLNFVRRYDGLYIHDL